MFFSPLAMRELISTLGPRTRETIAAALPGPVTLVVDNPEGLYPLACREDRARLGIRLIEGPLAGAERAILQTSANQSGESAPWRFADLDPRVIASADLALDGGDLTGLPSTVVDVTAIERGGEPAVLREGALSAVQARRLLERERGW
jgi:tRNA A37 threonylcarbamoyladenosine synthetase subunit TsaC/SUA5/YrdC